MKLQFLSLLIVAACNGNNFLYVKAGDAQTNKLLQVIVSDINASTGCKLLSLDNGKVLLSEDVEIERRFVSVIRNSDELKLYHDGKDLGVFDYFSNQIFYSETFDFETFSEGIKFLLMHELGHAMGLEHTENTVMNAEYKFMPYDAALESLIDLLNKHNKNQCNGI